MEEKINVFNSYFKSIFDFNSYNTLYKRSIGKAFLYLMLLTFTLGFVSALRPLYNFNYTLNRVIENIGSAPNFEFKNGVLTVNSNTILTYKCLDYAYIIDAKGTSDGSTLDKFQKGFLLTKDSLFEKDNSGTIVQIPLSSLKYLEFSKSTLEQTLPTLRFANVLFLMFYPIKFFINYLFNALILSLIGLIINSIMKAKIKFGGLFKLSLYALSLSTTFNLIINLTDKSIPNLFIYLDPIFYGVGFIYLLKALTVIKLNES